MNGTKQLMGTCSECGAPIRFPAEAIGTVSRCPHCGQQTELFLALTPTESGLPRKGLVWVILAVVILVLGVGGSLIGLKYFQGRVAQQKGRAAAKASVQAATLKTPAGLTVTAVALEKSADGASTYAAGSISNATTRQRFGVSLELELLDASGRKVGTATVWKALIEPQAQWEFRAPVSEAKAAAARVAVIQENR